MTTPRRIEHLVVLMLENRSFDHLLGDLARRGLIEADGGSPDMANTGLNGDPIGLSVAPREVGPDPAHDLASVATSLVGENEGFVLAGQRERAARAARRVRRPR